MPSPRTLLPWILGGTVGAAGILQGIHWKSVNAEASVEGLENQLRIAGEENEMLRRENESLRSLAQGGGEMSVPQELVDRIEKEFGLRFLSTPVVHRLATEELRDRITAAIESRYGPTGLDDRQESYRYIGWLRPEDDLLAQLAAVRAVGAVAWFDELSGEGWVTDKFVMENIPDQAALVRLLTRIILHQNFPPGPVYPGDDEARAREAMHQGAASGSEARYFAANARAIGFMPMKGNPEAEQLMASLSPFMRELVTFPSVEGKGLADTLHVQGDEKFHETFRNPPRTTRGIYFPDEPRTEPRALELPATSEEAFLTETAGMLGLRLWLEEVVPDEVAEIVKSWKNDRYLLFPDGEQSSAILWDIELSDEKAADQLEAAALARAGALAGQEQPLKIGEVAASEENRHFLITRPSPLRVRFLNTFERETAVSLGGK